PMTRSPTFQPVTPSPSASTSPAESAPAARPCALEWYDGARRNSPRFSAQARTRTRSSPAFGSGGGTSRNSSTAPASLSFSHQDFIPISVSLSGPMVQYPHPSQAGVPHEDRRHPRLRGHVPQVGRVIVDDADLHGGPRLAKGAGTVPLVR